jgi:hypothetical protein
MAITAQERQDILNTISDHHKLAFGYRPRGIDYHSMSDEELEACCDEYASVCDENEKEDAIRLKEDFIAYNNKIQEMMTNGLATDRLSAIKAMYKDSRGDTSADSYQDVEYFLWDKGILFHETRKALYEEVENALGQKFRNPLM